MADSGIVCGMCWHGAQCHRNLEFGRGTLSFTTDPTGCPPGSYKTIATFVGSYTIECFQCPPQR
jgi:hypothetical protein